MSLLLAMAAPAACARPRVADLTMRRSAPHVEAASACESFADCHARLVEEARRVHLGATGRVTPELRELAGGLDRGVPESDAAIKEMLTGSDADSREAAAFAMTLGGDIWQFKGALVTAMQAGSVWAIAALAHAGYSPSGFLPAPPDTSPDLIRRANAIEGHVERDAGTTPISGVVTPAPRAPGVFPVHIEKSSFDEQAPGGYPGFEGGAPAVRDPRTGEMIVAAEGHGIWAIDRSGHADLLLSAYAVTVLAWKGSVYALVDHEFTTQLLEIRGHTTTSVLAIEGSPTAMRRCTFGRSLMIGTTRETVLVRHDQSVRELTSRDGGLDRESISMTRDGAIVYQGPFNPMLRPAMCDGPYYVYITLRDGVATIRYREFLGDDPDPIQRPLHDGEYEQIRKLLVDGGLAFGTRVAFAPTHPELMLIFEKIGAREIDGQE